MDGWPLDIVACMAILCLFVQTLTMCGLVHMASRWNHVSFWDSGKRRHLGDMLCLRMVCFQWLPMH